MTEYRLMPGPISGKWQVEQRTRVFRPRNGAVDCGPWSVESMHGSEDAAKARLYVVTWERDEAQRRFELRAVIHAKTCSAGCRCDSSGYEQGLGHGVTFSEDCPLGSLLLANLRAVAALRAHPEAPSD